MKGDFYGGRDLECKGCGDIIFSKYDVYIIQCISKILSKYPYDSRPKKFDLTNIYDVLIENTYILEKIQHIELNLIRDGEIYSFNKKQILSFIK